MMEDRVKALEIANESQFEMNKMLSGKVNELERRIGKLEETISKVDSKQATSSLRLEYHIDNLKDVFKDLEKRFKHHINDIDSAHRI